MQTMARSFFFQAEDGIRDIGVTGVQTCALPIFVDVVDVDNVRDIGDVYDSKAIPKTAPPGMEEVAGPNRKPANGAESKPRAEAEARASAKPEERYVCGSPNRLISRVNRAGPPGP